MTAATLSALGQATPATTQQSPASTPPATTAPADGGTPTLTAQPPATSTPPVTAPVVPTAPATARRAARDAKPQETKPETKQGETKTGEGTSKDVKPGDTKQDIRPNNGKPTGAPHKVQPEEAHPAPPEEPTHPEFLRKSTGTTEVGLFGEAAYRIDVPANWNHQLVVFYHGYNQRPTLFHANNGLTEVTGPILKQGFAIAQSGYSTVGWSLEHAPLETETLRKYFLAHYGQPTDTYVVGVSMGGALAVMTIETNPKPYRGALDLCGAVGSSLDNFERRFAWRAAFDFYFPGLMPPLVSPTNNYPEPPPETEAMRLKILAALKQKPEAAAAVRALTHMRSDNDLSYLMNYITFVLADMQHKAGGNPYDNRNYLYVGTNSSNSSSISDDQLNDGVRRYSGERHAQAYLAAYYTPNGRITRPVLALHTLFDQLVPANNISIYAHQVEAEGYGQNLVQRYVHHEGHCSFTPDEVTHAMDDLVTWTHTGKRPEPGFQK